MLTECPHCGRPGICPTGTCLVRDAYDRTGAKAPARASRKAPASLGKRPTTAKASRAARTFAKREILALWDEAAKADRTLKPKAIPYGHRGSKLVFYSVRISGSLADIKNTLADLKTLRRFESGTTRLGVSLSELTEKSSAVVIPDCWVCYIQIYQRG